MKFEFENMWTYWKGEYTDRVFCPLAISSNFDSKEAWITIFNFYFGISWWKNESN